MGYAADGWPIYGRGVVTEGFALGFGWLELLVLLTVLGYYLLRGRR